MVQMDYLSETLDNSYAVHIAFKVLWINKTKRPFIPWLGRSSVRLRPMTVLLVTMAYFVVACESNNTSESVIHDDGFSGSGGSVAATAGSSGVANNGLGGTINTAVGDSGPVSRADAAAGRGPQGGIIGIDAGPDGSTAGAGGRSGEPGPTGGNGAGGATTTPGSWPTADPGKTGPYQTATENNVGPDNDYTMFRPSELTQRHPVITWGNGTGTSPAAYASLLSRYASHGFIVIASNSPNVAQGDPPPMLNGVTWVLEQDTTQGSVLFERVDRDHIGATGHSQGAIAASTAGYDPRIKTIAPLATLMAWRGGFHGPVLGLCGELDTLVTCESNRRSFDAITDQPVMYAELLGGDHGNWMFCFGSDAVCPMYMITTAWFRVHLMNDTALRSMFYGECTICQDTETWITDRKMMD